MSGPNQRRRPVPGGSDSVPEEVSENNASRLFSISHSSATTVLCIIIFPSH